MGVSISVDHVGCDHDDILDHEKLSREAKERLLKERGVLIPPAFGIVLVGSGSSGGSDSDSTGMHLSPSVQESHGTSMGMGTNTTSCCNNGPCPWQRLCRMDPSYGLLHDYMQPGFWAKTGNQL